MLQGALEDPVREPCIPRKQRAVQIRAYRVANTHAFEAALAVVPEPSDDAPERFSTLVEPRDARMVLEAGERPTHARLELALQQAVADHPSLAGNRLVRE